jgi:hypothetical protein
MSGYNSSRAWQDLVDFYENLEAAASNREVVAMSKKTPRQASKEDVLHAIMDDLRSKFPIDSGDEDPTLISDPQIRKARKAKRDLMLNRASEIFKEFGKNGVYPRPDVTSEGQLIKEIIKRLAKGMCPCRDPNCPAKQPSISASAGGCSCGGSCGGSCSGKCGGSHGSGGGCGGSCGGKCGHKKP